SHSARSSSLKCFNLKSSQCVMWPVSCHRAPAQADDEKGLLFGCDTSDFGRLQWRGPFAFTIDSIKFIRYIQVILTKGRSPMNFCTYKWDRMTCLSVATMAFIGLHVIACVALCEDGETKEPEP